MGTARPGRATPLRVINTGSTGWSVERSAERSAERSELTGQRATAPSGAARRRAKPTSLTGLVRRTDAQRRSARWPRSLAHPPARVFLRTVAATGATCPCRSPAPASASTITCEPCDSCSPPLPPILRARSKRFIWVVRGRRHRCRRRPRCTTMQRQEGSGVDHCVNGFLRSVTGWVGRSSTCSIRKIVSSMKRMGPQQETLARRNERGSRGAG